MNRSYDGPPIDGTYQYITERPEIRGDGRGDEPPDEPADELDEAAEEVVYATEPEPPGEERTEGVPIPGADRPDRPDPSDPSEQSTLSDWGGGAP